MSLENKGEVKIRSLKRIFINIRTILKILIVISIATFIIIGIVVLFFSPTYSVSFNGEFIGYSKNKTKLQNRINEYMNNPGIANAAFVEIEELPEYKLCLLKNDVQANDDEIFEKVKSTGITYYTYYAILDNKEEKYYVATADEAQSVIDKLKEKKSNNKDDLGFIQKYETELKEFTDVETVVSKLYEKPPVQRTLYTAKISTAANYTSKKVDLGIDLIRPTSGIITSRFGSRGSGRHTGLDIAAAKGTTIKAAAGGTVTFSGEKGTYGLTVIISHGNGVETYYAHCNRLVVKAGQTVSQGEKIAEMGSTGNSTGPHLHLEIRVNGVAQNPQNYLY